jgi:hypothetical protein
VDPRVVVNRRQAERLLTAVSYQGRIGPRLVAFFACLYYAGIFSGGQPCGGGWFRAFAQLRG